VPNAASSVATASVAIFFIRISLVVDGFIVAALLLSAK
jgi:hypothetical protein